jgi:hypothetical protein
MKSLGTSKALVIGLYLNAALIAVALLVYLNRPDSPSLMPTAFAQQNPQPIAGGAGLFLMPGQIATNAWGCYVMDVDRQTLMVYQYNPGDRKLKLLAAREFAHDRRLREFNTDSPTPSEVETMTRREADNARVAPK